MQSTRYMLLAGFILAAMLAQQCPVNADAPRFLFGTPKLVEGISTPGVGEYSTTLTPDGLELFFASNSGARYNPTALYVARRASPDAPFTSPEILDSLVTEGRYLENPSISSDGLTLYYKSYTNTVFEIWEATRPTRSAEFGSGTLLIEPPAGALYLWQNISSDSLSLYVEYYDFAMNDIRLYVSHRSSVDQAWGDVEPVPDLSGLDRTVGEPFISADGLALFFLEVNGPISRSVQDLGVVVRPSVDAPWSAPVNLGNAINTTLHESNATLTADGKTLYFTRLDPTNSVLWNSSDIWQAPVLPFETVGVRGNGGAYLQNFDSLGTAASEPGTPLPTGWTFTANDVVFNNSTTREFPVVTKPYAGVYNAGADGAVDRTLVTDVTRNETGELDFRTLLTDSPLQALRLGFDIEAWQVRIPTGANPGEAAFHVVLEADSGSGFQQVADLGEFSTGKTLARPATGNLVDGNDPAYRRSFDSGPVDLDVPAGATLRTRWIGTESSRNVVFGLDNVSLWFGAPGDANIDGVFNATDLVQVLQAGEYADQLAGNSTWADGDWNGDSEFDSLDLVAALQAGGYGQAAGMAALVPEPSSALLGLIGLAAVALARCLRRSGPMSRTS